MKAISYKEEVVYPASGTIKETIFAGINNWVDFQHYLSRKLEVMGALVKHFLLIDGTVLFLLLVFAASLTHLLFNYKGKAQT